MYRVTFTHFMAKDVYVYTCISMQGIMILTYANESTEVQTQCPKAQVHTCRYM